MNQAKQVLAPDEVALVTRKFNATEVPVDTRCLPDLLREQARIRPDAVAIRYEDESLTFRELVARAEALAGALLESGVDGSAGLFAEPSLELPVGAWGILFAGAAYLPLSPEYPEERLRYMIEDHGVGVILTQPGLVARATELAPGARVVTFEGSGERRVPVSADDLAYVIYTSGSTGKPKGVMVDHRAIVNQMRWLQRVQCLDESRVVLQKTPMSFDAAQWEILAPCVGAQVVVGGPGAYRDPDRLLALIRRYDVTTIQCVPTLLQALVDTEELSTCDSLRQVFSGGEALSKALALECVTALPDCALVNLYGPTECTINSSAHTVDRDALAEGPPTISIGAPVDNTQYYILDERREPVAVGEVGELYVGGIQLARGYLRRPDLTGERFIDNPFQADFGYSRLYRTGDLGYWNADGTVQFVGRTDNQVKLRGFRVELDEIRLAIENHEWVKNAAVVVKDGGRFQELIAFIELNPKEAALMDQGNHGAHHQSKQSKLQIKAQLANSGCRDAASLSGKPVVDLRGWMPTPEQRRRVFARKTYRFFEGGTFLKADILKLLDSQVGGVDPRAVGDLDFAEFGEILRYFGQFQSNERLLPKYGYASPGSLYATQMYFELNAFGLRPGFYYYQPVLHQLILIESATVPAATVKVHFIGKKQAIEPVYKNNIQEVLEIEAGHMVGLFEEILPEHGFDMRAAPLAPEVKSIVECPEEDYYLGAFEVIPYSGPRPDDALDVYVQSHPGRVADLPAGQYRYADGDLHRVSGELVLKKHVIAINQQVYERASIGISLVARGESWRSYVDLGRKLHHLQMNELNFGFMSAGYSSKTGNDLPSARRLDGILGTRNPSYFSVGGKVSDEQVRAMGMKEDVVHMKGPTELIRDDLLTCLPDYMMPNRVVVLDRLPLTVNGKIDSIALSNWDIADVADRPFVAPRSLTEARIAGIWTKVMRRDTVSVLDDFFESGGNSLIAVALVNKINKEFRTMLPLQVVFEAPTVEKLATLVDCGDGRTCSRLVRLRSEGSGSPIFCWPGLGGYAMNLRTLAGKIDRPFLGVQAYGINAGETPYRTIREMAAADVEVIRRLQPSGPYTLWGYSFGARVAFESAYQLELAGEQVDHLFLLAPGAPRVRAGSEAYLTILYSVFAGSITGPLLDECLRTVDDDESFVAFISARFDGLDPDLVRRIVRVVRQTYQFKYVFSELAERRISAPVTIFKARGDDYSFIENSSGYSAVAPTVIDVDADHYSMLKDPGIDALVKAIAGRLTP
ncbi:amino acid adenylation domain-containing protein [Amycolatopsis xylanica]|uniref:Amino acid adenylation domain-containing protein n=1 Tax=Amycolatopsis xylanica TaxID=589385 RepID=A0A1H3K7H4_9PSEU|nr:amino acid adenylation domain-containing protein [Amycolatopsis xylanica]SDY47454.1 amino acid adenylation domain-containing protein [Amycolatopsis xylanica]